MVGDTTGVSIPISPTTAQEFGRIRRWVAMALTTNRAARLVRVMSPAPADLWRQLFDGDPLAIPDQSPGYSAALAGGGRWNDCSRAYEFEDGRAFVLPLLRARRSLRSGSMPPALGFGGLVGVDPDPGVIAAVAADLSSSQISIRVRPNPLHDDLWCLGAPDAIRLPLRAHVVDLDGSADEVWKRMRSLGRRGVKKARSSGVEVRVSHGGDALAEYRSVMESSVERWAEQQHEPRVLALFRARRREPAGELERMAEHLGERFRLLLAYLDGQPIAANLAFVDGTGHGMRAAIDKDRAGPVRAAYLLQWLQLEAACEAGCRWYHMGESGQSESLSFYKERFGAYPVDYAAYEFERIPLGRADRAVRSVVKRLIRFQD